MQDTHFILLAGVHSLAFAAFHAGFWKLFDWPRDLRANSVATRAVVQILNLRLIYVFLGIAALCLAFPDELAGSALGRALLAGMALFWVGRTIEQWVFLPYNTPLVHRLTAAFVAGAGLFAAPLLT
ncbi:hypothetical protein [Arenimonas sp. MALMAid1274]|uniref:hypothetical protein n=1 Tax=Arenimonas sp. MALMAid1274 TaxID=3411630 RepID=UPI003B9E5A4F